MPRFRQTIIWPIFLKMHIALRILAVLIGLSLLTPGLAISAGMVMSDGEFGMLPEYCRQKSHVSVRHSVSNQAYFEGSASYVGSLHHYCWALVNLTRSYRAGISIQERTSILSNVVADIDYVFNNHPVTSGNSSLFSEMYGTRGLALLRLGNARAAESSFQEANKLDPQNWRAYLQWAIYLRQAGRNKEALKVVEEGLENTPDSRALKSLQSEIQGNPSKGKKEQ